jgi:hypothetical protein
MVLSLLLFSYLFSFKPFDNKRSKVVEIINEVIILSCSCLMLVYTDNDLFNTS